MKQTLLVASTGSGLTKRALGSIWKGMFLIVALTLLPVALGIQHAEASTTLKGPYSATATLDGDPSTAWCEGHEGQGEGEKLTLHLNGSGTKGGLEIRTGFQKSTRLFDANGAAAEMDLTLHAVSGASRSLRIKIAKRMGWQHVDVDLEGVTKVAMTIIAVHPGRHYRDTCVSDLRVIPKPTGNVKRPTFASVYDWHSEDLAKSTSAATDRLGFQPEVEKISPVAASLARAEDWKAACVDSSARAALLVMPPQPPPPRVKEEDQYYKGARLEALAQYLDASAIDVHSTKGNGSIVGVRMPATGEVDAGVGIAPVHVDEPEVRVVGSPGAPPKRIFLKVDDVHETIETCAVYNDAGQLVLFAQHTGSGPSFGVISYAANGTAASVEFIEMSDSHDAEGHWIWQRVKGVQIPSNPAGESSSFR